MAYYTTTKQNIVNGRESRRGLVQKYMRMWEGKLYICAGRERPKHLWDLQGCRPRMTECFCLKSGILCNHS